MTNYAGQVGVSVFFFRAGFQAKEQAAGQKRRKGKEKRKTGSGISTDNHLLGNVMKGPS